MSQNDFTIANQTFPNTRADINSALQALASTSSGSSAPSTTFANQFFYNTTSNLLQIRNEDNDAFITIAELDQTNDDVEYFKCTALRLARIEFQDGDDALSIADGGGVTVHTSLDMNGTELILEADADTSITADTDDQIDFRVANANRAYITKNTIGGIINRRNAKPLIINGDMQVAQRGTSTTGITTSGYYTVDRFAVTISALGTWTQTQDTTVPTAKGFTKSLKMDCTTADASPAAGDLVLLSYKIEAQDLQLLKYGTSNAEAFTLRFHVRSPKTGTHIVHMYQNDGNRHISQAYTISSANTYQEVIINIPGDTGGTTNNDNACGLQIEFYLAAGSNSTSGTLATSWAGYTQANSAVGQVNCADNTANNFFITGLQMEVGEYTSTTMPPFEHELFGECLARGQRYFQTIDAGRVNTSGFGHCESSTVQVTLPLAAIPRVLARYDGEGTLTKVGDIAVNAFPSGGDNITAVSTFIVMGASLQIGMTTSASTTNGDSEPVRYGSATPQTIFQLDTEL